MDDFKGETIKDINELSLDQKITRFLLDMNKLMDGIHIEEVKAYEGIVKFEATLTCLYADHGMFSPSPLFYQVLEKCCKRHFRESTYSNFDFNNTQTIFWVPVEQLNE